MRYDSQNPQHRREIYLAGLSSLLTAAYGRSELDDMLKMGVISSHVHRAAVTNLFSTSQAIAYSLILRNPANERAKTIFGVTKVCTGRAGWPVSMLGGLPDGAIGNLLDTVGDAVTGLLGQLTESTTTMFDVDYRNIKTGETVPDWNASSPLESGLFEPWSDNVLNNAQLHVAMHLDHTGVESGISINGGLEYGRR